MRITANDGGVLWADVRGSGEPLLLLSGMSQSHEGLAGQFPLSEHFSLVVMDNRGTGASSDWHADHFYGQDGPMTGDFTDDVVTVLDELGIERAHVFGFSLGGRVAQWLASRYPKRVGALILCSTSVGVRKGVAREEEISDTIRLCGPFDLALMNYTPQWLGKHDPLLRQVNESTSTRGAQRELHWNAAAAHDSWTALPSIKSPTLILHGTDDPITPFGNAQILADNIANAQVVPIEGGRHAIATEFSQRINSLVTDFIQQHPLESL